MTLTICSFQLELHKRLNESIMNQGIFGDQLSLLIDTVKQVDFVCCISLTSIQDNYEQRESAQAQPEAAMGR